MAYTNTNAIQDNIYLHFRVTFFLAFAVLLSFSVSGQTCTTPIQNNSFVIQPAVCPGTVALLQGTVPTGGNGTYTYRWECTFSNTCSDNNFTPIPGATQKDFSVPSFADPDWCYRRIITSGNCSSTSNKTKVQGADRTTPSPPTVTAVSPSCTAGGTITITAPAPSPGISYSINGTDYSNTSGTFTSLAAGSYSVTVRLLSGCTSPSRTVNLSAAAPPTGVISPANASICPGQSQVLTITGGTSYRWYRNNVLIAGATSNTYTATQAGTYKADIINGSCTGTSSNNSTITQLAAPSGTITPANANLCAGDSINLSVSGGSSYQWYKDNVLIPGAVASVYKAKQGGVYEVEITGNNGCRARATNSAVVTLLNAPSGTITPATATICPGGSATLTSNGGSSYRWYKDNVIIPGATSATYVATQQGSYKTEITNASGCKAFSSSAVVSAAPAPSGSVSPASGTICTNGSLTLTVTGGASYQWYRNAVLISGATSSTYLATQAGTYTADIISAEGCRAAATNSSIITPGAAPTGSISPGAAIICGNQAVTLTTGGGTSYQWFLNGNAIAGATVSTYVASLPGTYSVTIFTGSCSGPASNTAVLTAGPAPNGSITPASAAICSGSSQLLTATGGLAYQWYKDNVLIPGATAATYPATQAGTYSVDLTGSNGCKAKAANSSVITVTPLPSGSISPASGQLCNNNSLTLSVSGGDSYQWFKNAVAIAGATGGTYLVTSPGNYSANIIAGNCVGPSSNTVVVTQVSSPTGSISPSSANICPGASQLLTASGATSYQWFKNSVLITGETSPTYLATAPGVYSVLLSNGLCSAPATNSTTITEFSLPQGTITPASATICNNGSQLLTASGGSSYQWYKNGVAIIGATAATYNATDAGLFDVDVTSSDGCKAKSLNSSVVTIITAPTGSISPASGTICTNGSLLLTATGGTSYQWYRNGVVISGATASAYTVTQAGTYTADVLNNGGCRAPATNAAIITLAAAPVGSIAPATATICPAQNVTLTTSGGNSYQWSLNGNAIAGATTSTYVASLPGTYSVTIFGASCSGPASNTAVVTAAAGPAGNITPANAAICPGYSQVLTASGGLSYQWFKDNILIPGATAASYTATQQGIYSVELTGSDGCKAKAANQSVITLAPVPSGSISPASGTLCVNGSLLLTATGGASYQWYRNGVLISGATSSTYSVTQAGTYSADIINAAGCKAPAANTATIAPGAAPTGSIVPATANVCTGQTVTLTTGGGTSYQWFLNGNAIQGATTSTYAASLPGTYSVSIFSGSCNGAASNTAIVSASVPINFSVSTVQPTCSQPQGSITMNNVSGGSGGYLYSINNGAVFQTGNTFTNLLPGSYSLIVKDASDCRSIPQLVIIHAAVSTLQASFTTTDITCTQPTGTVTISATGGTAPYQYSLNGAAAQASNSFANLTAGLHKVLIKDASGCSVEINFAIQTINSTLSATVTTTNPGCGQQTGAVLVTATGGTPGYTYSIDNGVYQAANSFSNLATGTHHVKVKDAAGCITQVNFQIAATGTLPTLIVTNPPSICIGATANLQHSSVTTGSDTALTLTYWNDSGATSPVPNPGAVVAGKYFIKAVNRSGCVTIKPVTVSVAINTGSISVQGSVAPCQGQVVTLRASNGRSYQWYRNNNLIGGATSNTYVVTADGSYSVFIDDGNCRAFAKDTIAVQYKDCPTMQDPNVFVPKAFSPNNNNANDVLRPILYKIRELRYFRVYNRWGQMVFQTREIGKGWDGVLNGKPQPTDAFSWMLECVDANGNIIKKSGQSILIR